MSRIDTEHFNTGHYYGFGRDVYFHVEDIFIVSNRFVIGPFQIDVYSIGFLYAPQWTVAYKLILFGNKYFLIAVDISFKFETSLKMAETVYDKRDGVKLK